MKDRPNTQADDQQEASSGSQAFSRNELLRDLRRAYEGWLGDWRAHELAHKGPLAHTVAGSGPGSECCRYFAERTATARAALDEALVAHRRNIS